MTVEAMNQRTTMTDITLLRWDLVLIALKIGGIGLAVWWVVEQCVEIASRRPVETIVEQKRKSWR
jgi:hypothetical protein